MSWGMLALFFCVWVFAKTQADQQREICEKLESIQLQLHELEKRINVLDSDISDQFNEINFR